MIKPTIYEQVSRSAFWTLWSVTVLLALYCIYDWKFQNYLSTDPRSYIPETAKFLLDVTAKALLLTTVFVVRRSKIMSLCGMAGGLLWLAYLALPRY